MHLDKEKLEAVENKIRKIIRQQGLDLIDFKIIKHRASCIVRTVVDYATGGVTIDECSRLNRMIFSLLEKENIFGEDFSVEVNSPGLDRPIRERVDFLRVRGNEIMIWLSEPVGGKTYIEAIVCGLSGDMLLLKTKDASLEIPLGIVKIAKQKINILDQTKTTRKN